MLKTEESEAERSPEEEQEHPNYYGLIPANVRYDTTLVPRARLLYSEISALCNKFGYCVSKNKYFAELYKVTNQAISGWIHQLEEKGYIDVVIDKKKGNRRKIYLSESQKLKDPIERRKRKEAEAAKRRAEAEAATYKAEVYRYKQELYTMKAELERSQGELNSLLEKYRSVSLEIQAKSGSQNLPNITPNSTTNNTHTQDDATQHGCVRVSFAAQQKTSGSSKTQEDTTVQGTPEEHALCAMYTLSLSALRKFARDTSAPYSECAKAFAFTATQEYRTFIGYAKALMENGMCLATPRGEPQSEAEAAKFWFLSLSELEQEKLEATITTRFASVLERLPTDKRHKHQVFVQAMTKIYQEETRDDTR